VILLNRVRIKENCLMSIKNRRVRLSGLNTRFILYFLLFSFAPLFVFSILGYYLNRNIIRQIHSSLMDDEISARIEHIADYLAAQNRESASLIHRLLAEKNQLVPESESIQSSSSGDCYVIFAADRQCINHGLSQPAVAELEKMTGASQRLVCVKSTRQLFIKYQAQGHTLFRSADQHQNRQMLHSDNRNRSFELLLNSSNIVIKEDSAGVNLTLHPPVANSSDNPYLDVIFRSPATIVRDRPIDEVWTLRLTQSTHGMFGELEEFLNQIIAANLVLLVIVFSGAVILSRRIINPIYELMIAVNKISEGELTHEIKVDSRDEIQTLAEEFERMRRKLLESYSTLESKIEERTLALRDAQFQISHQEKMASLGLLAAGVAHEIGNPLTSISSMAQLIKRRVDDPQIKEYITTIMQNIDRISKIVRELVDFARPSSYESEYVDVNEVLRNAVNIVKYDRRAKNINIIFEVDANLPRIYLVSDQLLQVFINILINAVDALKKEKGVIYVKSFEMNGFANIHFIDNGIGIPGDHISKIFEPFFTTKKVGKGTGLGLTVSYGIIKNFNGNIIVESRLNEGSNFKIQLPVNGPELTHEG
jgi:signal transduction histidine kinase